MRPYRKQTVSRKGAKVAKTQSPARFVLLCVFATFAPLRENSAEKTRFRALASQRYQALKVQALDCVYPAH
jgi:hypothetical protein